MYSYVCFICGTAQDVGDFSDFTCDTCGQRYLYDENQTIALTEHQWSLLREDWEKSRLAEVTDGNSDRP